MKFDVLGLGHCCIDHLSILDPFPEKGKKGVVIESCTTGGGPVPTALRVVTRFGGTATFCGKVGNDNAGKQIISELNDDDIETNLMVIEPETITATASIWIDPTDGSRTIALDTPEFPWVTTEQFNADLVRNCRVFITDGRAIGASLEGLRVAREAGIPTVFDTGSGRPGMYEMLPLIDYAIVSQDLSEHLDPKVYNPKINVNDSMQTSLALAKHLVKFGAGAALITMGELGVMYHDEVQTMVSPAFKVKAYDTTGAGDVFHGAFIHALLQDWKINRALRFANAAAALSCRKLSGSGGIPELDEVVHVLRDGVIENKPMR